MEALMQLIKSRQSSRIAFDPQRRVSRDDIMRIIEAGSWAPTAHNMQNYEVVVVDDPVLIERIRSIEFPPNPTFIQENYLQLSFSEEESRRRGTGVMATMFPKTWLRPGLIPEHPHAGDLGILQYQQDREAVEDSMLERHNQLLSCPALVMLVYDPERRAPRSERDFLGIMSLGCVLENMWLMAHSLGIHLHVVSALSEEKVQVEIRRMLEIPGSLEIAISFRLGYPAATTDYLRVRRDAGSFTHYNGFGQSGF